MLFTFLQQALTQHDTTKVGIGLQSLQNVTIQRFAGQSRFLIAETPAILLFFASNHVCERRAHQDIVCRQQTYLRNQVI